MKLEAKDRLNSGTPVVAATTQEAMKFIKSVFGDFGVKAKVRDISSKDNSSPMIEVQTEDPFGRDYSLLFGLEVPKNGKAIVSIDVDISGDAYVDTSGIRNWMRLDSLKSADIDKFNKWSTKAEDDVNDVARTLHLYTDWLLHFSMAVRKIASASWKNGGKE